MSKEVETPEVKPATTKHILESKTLWVNILSIVVLIAQQKWGFVISESAQVEILSAINIGLRMITKDEVTWK